jgi:hypothetical protein
MADPERVDALGQQAGTTADTYLLGVEIPPVGPRTAVLIQASTLPSGGGNPDWGDIGGTLGNQADLSSALSAKAALNHSHSSATGIAAGFLAAADKVKLDGIDTGAQVNPTTSAIVDALDAALGGEGWRAAAAGSAFALVGVVKANADGSPIAAESSGYVPYDTVVYPASGAPVSAVAGEVTFTTLGTFLILTLTGVTFSTASYKGYAPVTLQTDESGSWATVPPGVGVLSISGSSTNTDHQKTHEIVAGVLTLGATGKKLRTKVEAPTAGTSAVTTKATRCVMLIFQIGGTAGGGGALSFYDEATLLGEQGAVKFLGAGVSAAVNGSVVEVTIPGTAVVAGSDRQVQFNASGVTAGAAGVTVLSPTNTRSLVNHVLCAANVELVLLLEDVAAGGTVTPDPANGAEHRIVLTGNATISAAAMGGSDLANNRIRVVNCLVFNNTANTVTVQTPTGAAASGLWTRAWGSDGGSASSFQVPSYARRECAAVVYRDASGTLFTEWRG